MMQLTLTGITHGHGSCFCCGRLIGRVFGLSDGNVYGRRCAAKATGFKVTDQDVRMAAHRAAVNAERRAAGWTADRFADYARESGWVNEHGIMILHEGRPHVLDWADRSNKDLWA